ncbi:HlyD family efflux transporter periplasmic adaptor subunit [Trinickia fusca]|uniref:HlyD family efflux transporter periplasmic adaptor subunit n=1 Tax=Trinickia fusca TaxID=2419777 RepID=A0A494XJL5_9BURK|nr:HlyD family efflux transporter periplasmic adaptor subunit [Trinickia fusca]RKP48319.1 HlyD family efflux transporter periplasmic adaptor subunit [Trinickia fusca]
MSQPTPSQAAPTTDQAQASHASFAARRRRYFRAFGVALVLIAAVVTVWWWLESRNVESTDDAYVAGDVVQISPRVAGTAVAVLAQNTDWVESGTPLVEIDKTDMRVALDAAVNALAHSVRDYRSANADASRELAQIRLRESDLARAQDDLQRRLAVAADGGVAKEEIRHAHDAVAAAQAALDAQRAAYRASLAHVDGTTIDSSPLVKAAATQVRSAALALSRTDVRAPIAGRVTRRLVQVGQHVAPGTPVMELVPLDRVWVDANFKESQLRRMRPGQPVELRADLYGDDVVYHGTIEGFEAGTGAAFAALPAQNATGNWIKVVQRVPVRIALDARELRAHPLLIGLSMTATVRMTGVARPGEVMATTMAMPPLSEHTARTPDTTTVYDDEAHVGDALVARTIRANSGIGIGIDEKAAP